MTERKFTVVIPTYNHHDFILDAYESVNKSTVKADIIIVNDGSTDRTSEILKGFRNTESVQILEQENMGAASALNKAIDLAKTEFVSILNDDDLYETRHLETIAKIFDSTNSDLVVSSPSIFGSGEKVNQLRAMPAIQSRLFSKVGLFWSLFQMNWALSTSAFAFRKEFWGKGIRFKNFKLCHDLDFLLNAMINHGAVISINRQPTWSYRCHGSNSGSRISTEEGNLEIATCLLHNLLNLDDIDFFSIIEGFIGYELPREFCFQVMDNLITERIPIEKNEKKRVEFCDLQQRMRNHCQ